MARCTLGLPNRSHQDRFISVKVGDFILNFVEDLEFTDSWAKGIAHIGLQFKHRHSVDEWYRALTKYDEHGDDTPPPANT